MNTRLYLLFNLNTERFAVNTKNVTEVVPLLEIIKVPKTAAYICGLVNYRGSMITVIDANSLLYDTPYNKKLCSRIIIIEVINNGQQTKIGLIAEKVNRTCYLNASEMTEHELNQQNTPYLGKIINHQEGNIQIIDLNNLVSHEFEQLHNVTHHNQNNNNETRP